MNEGILINIPWGEKKQNRHNLPTPKGEKLNEAKFVNNDLLIILPVDLEKKAQCESCTLSFIWDKMKTAAGESTSDSSEKLLQRRICQSCDVFANHEELSSP